MKSRIIALGMFILLTVGMLPTPIVTGSAESSANASTENNNFSSLKPMLTPTASVAWVAPSEFTWGPPNTMTVSGYAQGGSGRVQMHWRDLIDGNGWITVPWEPYPDLPNNAWTNTIDSPNRCHDYAVYVNYSGIQSETFYYRGLSSGYCNEQVSVIWIQPSSTAGTGSPGSLVVAGSAQGAPGYPIWMMYRNVTTGTGWVLDNDNDTVPNSNGIWINEIPNANPYHVYEVKVIYDVITSGVCTYTGQNSISWC